MSIINRIKDNLEQDFNSTFDALKESVKSFTKKPGAEATALSQEEALRQAADLDPRAILRVPIEYIESLWVESVATQGNGESTVTGNTRSDPLGDFKKLGGILFPYTPTISVDNKAEYAPSSPYHTNYQQYFYKNSVTGPIQVSGRFTVQDEYEGMILLATINLLRTLTKMRTGNDAFAGAPPPVCRFSAYGDRLYKNIPVVITSWKHELPDNVDYISVNTGGSKTIVPVLSTLTIDMNIVYSRRELMDYDVQSHLRGSLNKGFI